MDYCHQLVYNQLVIYDIPSNNSMWNNLKEKHIVKITYTNIINSKKEDMLVYITKINRYDITGIIANILLTKELEIGDVIIFNRTHINEISDKPYSLNDMIISREKIQNNPFTKYFQTLSTNF